MISRLLEDDALVASVAAIAGAVGLVVMLAARCRGSIAAWVLALSFAALAAAGVASHPAAPQAFAAAAAWPAAGGLLGVVVGSCALAVEFGRRRRRTTSEAEKARREIERLTAANDRMAAESLELGQRLTAAQKSHADTDSMRLTREAALVRQQRALDAANVTAKKHRSIFECAAEGMAMLERETLRLVVVNRSLCGMTGWQPEELSTRSLTDLFSSTGSQPGRADLHRSAREQRPFEVEIQRKDGGALWVELGVSVVGESTEAQLLAILRDVSARRTLEKELALHVAAVEERERRLEEQNRELADRARRIEEMNVRLQGMQEQKDHLVSTVSHELRTPLTSIRSFSEILIKHGEADPTIGREFLEIICKESERLTRLVDNVLDLANIEAGEMRLDLTSFDLRDVVADSIRSMSVLAAERRAVVRRLCGESARRTLADRDKLQQLVMNLLSNALKYGPEGGEIEILLKDGERPGRIELAVRDHGPGIPDEEREQVFEKFRRGGGAGARASGTGLGLAICREIARLHGGRIWVENERSRGCRFRVDLPGLDEARLFHAAVRPNARANEDRVASSRSRREDDVPSRAPVVEPVAAATAVHGARDWSETGSLPPLLPRDDDSRTDSDEAEGLPPIR